MGAEEFATITQLAADYGVHEMTVWGWVADAGLTRYKRQGDKKTYIKRAKLADWLGRRRQPSDVFKPRARKEK
jgi:hypothetical protein